MKKLSLSFLFAAFFVSMAQVQAQTYPKNEVFDQVAEQAEELGYFGYDVLACFSADNNQLVVGGVSFWNTTLQIYLVDGNGKAVATKTHKANMPDSKPKSFVFDADGIGVELFLSELEFRIRTRILKYKEASLQVGNSEVMQVLNCYFRNSGLE